MKKDAPILVRGIDRSKDYRIICEKCGKDFGGTFAAIPEHKIHYIVCQPCQWGTFDNFLADWKAKIEEGRNDNRSRTI